MREKGGRESLDLFFLSLPFSSISPDENNLAAQYAEGGLHFAPNCYELCLFLEKLKICKSSGTHDHITSNPALLQSFFR